MVDTTNLKLPRIAADQAQKHITHNTALGALDALVQLAVISRILTTPPAGPTEGDRYIIAATATGDWVGQENNVTMYLNGAWSFYVPQDGWLAFDLTDGAYFKYLSGAWSSILATGADTVGWWDYNDLATATTPIALTLADTWYNITNDGLGAFTKDAYALTGVADVWNIATDQFDFSGLDIGDMVEIRVDVGVDTNGTNTVMGFKITLDVGGVNVDVPLFRAYFKDATVDHDDGRITFVASLYIGTAGVRDNPAELKIRSDSTGETVEVNGFYVKVQKR